MKTLDILICTFNKGIVRVGELLREPREGIQYIVSYQYNDERYLDLIPESLQEREDVVVFEHRGQGLSANRNLALEKSKAELYMFADDDERFTDETFDTIFQTFDAHPDIDVAFFTATTYTGKPLKNYPDAEFMMRGMPESYEISTIEMVCRSSVKNKVRFDERFGLGAQFLTCGEEEIWMDDAVKAGLTMRFFPKKTVETSTLLKRRMIYVDAGVQRSHGAQEYYRRGGRAWWSCFRFALRAARKRQAHFFPMMKHMAEGIRYMQKTR
ncbi:MAG: glycosyltransferase family 2 protein [Bacteroidaceae bacterium]|nr:glycosyltransferase family 2 protein [Bacteroidaceae bacterium]